MKEEDPKNIYKIITQAKQGDSEAFEKLYFLYFTPLYKYIYYKVKSKETAEDLVQEVFMKFYKSLSRFNVQDVSPLAYFYTIARNSLIDHYRRKGTVRVSDEVFETLVDHEDTPEEASVKGDDALSVRKAISKLTHDQQDVILLKFINERSNREIATILGKTEEAVRQLQSRGLETLRGIMKTYYEK